MARSRVAILICAAGVATAQPALAADDADGDALRLADTAAAAPVTPSNWRGTFEAAFANYTAANQAASVTLNDNARVSNTLSYDGTFGNWRAIVSNRFDAGWRAGASRYNAVDTLKQAYVSWQASPNALVDLGRVNLREGVASGFNPTDFFKVGALRSVVSIDPESLRENRLGSVMMRGQLLWSGGSMTALVSPRLDTHPNDATFNPDLGATNARTRYMLSGSQRLFGNFSPQWLLYGGEGIAPQLGVNATTLIDDATVGFVEYAIGRGSAVGDFAQTASSWVSKLATGVTHTFASKLSLTLEYDYDGASASGAAWRALQGDPSRYWRYRDMAGTAQELMTRRSLFVYASMPDVFVQHLALTAMARYNLDDHSYFTWLEARYHWPRTDCAVQWQSNHGSARSVYGAQAQSEIVQAIATFFF
ncbi:MULTISPECIES: hypothetical protein [Burkholderia]|jgi:hypothetical protein|uniref:Porin n=2 Tax=Burkholderia cenocepacia TaxID=95486 RepID=A0A1V2W7Y0_9BURK|nr:MULTISPECIES: hypothetical protein [Burkholderia]AIO43460.1 hypothetical protein DM42_6957 [Burkholderia cepacia]AMU11413.1 hypothetical protein A2T82_34555 [Burkholderia cenocepacia]AOK36189.1 hypothetical protein WL90_17865 [Burkholderia cenocepacia]ELW9530770.1 hypothetical protein [Burkholderia cenocepacia]KGC04879.1 hypothetical protein DM44_6480 [Burkholderia cepacia]